MGNTQFYPFQEYCKDGNMQSYITFLKQNNLIKPSFSNEIVYRYQKEFHSSYDQFELVRIQLVQVIDIAKSSKPIQKEFHIIRIYQKQQHTCFQLIDIRNNFCFIVQSYFECEQDLEICNSMIKEHNDLLLSSNSQHIQKPKIKKTILQQSKTNDTKIDMKALDQTQLLQQFKRSVFIYDFGQKYNHSVEISHKDYK